MDDPVPDLTRPFGLSVVIPTLNRPEQLRAAIESVMTRRPEQVEIVVVDDGSTLPVYTAAPTCNAAGVPIRHFRFESNRGPQAARNLGIRRASFSYIAFLDSDDAFTPDKVDVVLASLAQAPADLLFHGVRGMDKYNRLGRLWDQRLRGWLPFHWWASLYNPAVTPALVIRRRVRLGLPWMRHCEDWFYLLRYVEPGLRVRYLDRELTTVFRTPRSPGGLSGAVWQMRRGEFAARSVLLREPGPANLARYAAGNLMGCLRILNDLIRARYWR